MAQKDEYYFFSTALGLTGNLTDLKRAFYTANVSTEAAKNPEGSGEVLFLKKYIENQSATPVSNYRSDLYKQALTIAGITPTKSYNKNKSLFYLSDTIRTNYAVTLQSYIKSLSNLFTYYPMDETSGNAINRAPATLGSYDASPTGPTQGVAGQSGTAYSFDGVNDRCSYYSEQLENASSFSVGMLCKVTDNPSTGTRALLHKYEWSGQQTFGIQISTNDKYMLAIKTSGTTVDLTEQVASVTYGSWMWLFGIYDGSNFTVYENNTQVGQIAATGTTSSTTASMYTYSQITTRYLQGLAQHLFTFTRALTEQERLDLIDLAGL